MKQEKNLPSVSIEKNILLSTPTAKQNLVIIIGGGISGICALRECTRKGLEAILFEEGEELGGVWTEFSEKNPWGRSYRSLTTNGSRPTLELSDADITKFTSRQYPTWSEMKNYYNYVSEEVKDRIRKGIRVTDVDFKEGLWEVKTQERSTGEEKLYKCNSLIVATGKLGHPNESISWANELRTHQVIPVIHSSYYIGPESLYSTSHFRKLNVAVIGIGSSALDISLELAEKGHKVSVCSSGALILPAFDDESNLPIDYIFLCRNFDRKEELDYMNRVSKKTTEIFTLNGMPEPREESVKITLLKRHKEYFKQIYNGNIRFYPYVKGVAVDQRNVSLQLVNGSELKGIDAVVLCTGYKLHFPFLRGDLSPIPLTQLHPDKHEDPQQDSVELYKHIMHPKYKSLFFVGTVKNYVTLGVMAELQARWVAAVLAGQLILPSDVMIQNWVANSRKYEIEQNLKNPFIMGFVPLVDMYLKDIDISIPKRLWSDSHPLIGPLFRRENWTNDKIRQLKSKL